MSKKLRSLSRKKSITQRPLAYNRKYGTTDLKSHLATHSKKSSRKSLRRSKKSSRRSKKSLRRSKKSSRRSKKSSRTHLKIHEKRSSKKMKKTKVYGGGGGPPEETDEKMKEQMKYYNSVFDNNRFNYDFLKYSPPPSPRESLPMMRRIFGPSSPRESSSSYRDFGTSPRASLYKDAETMTLPRASYRDFGTMTSPRESLYVEMKEPLKFTSGTEMKTEEPLRRPPLSFLGEIGRKQNLKNVEPIKREKPQTEFEKALIKQFGKFKNTRKHSSDDEDDSAW